MRKLQETYYRTSATNYHQHKFQENPYALLSFYKTPATDKIHTTHKNVISPTQKKYKIMIIKSNKSICAPFRYALKCRFMAFFKSLCASNIKTIKQSNNKQFRQDTSILYTSSIVFPVYCCDIYKRSSVVSGNVGTSVCVASVLVEISTAYVLKSNIIQTPFLTSLF